MISSLKFQQFVALLLTLTAVSTGCTSDTPRPGSFKAPIRIACTTGQVADLVRIVGGKHVEVDQLIGSQIDPHLFEPAIDTQRALHNADLVIYNGLHLEGRMTEVLASLAKRKPVFAVSEGLRLNSPDRLRRVDIDTGIESDAFDPHLWFDARLWSECAEYVSQKLSEIAPDYAADFQANALAYQQELAELDTWVREQIATIPEPQRILVTAHDAFGYFGHAYEIEVRGLQGLSTRDEVDIQEVKQLVNLLVARKIPAVFIEASVPERNVKTLIDNAKRLGHQVAIGGTLYSDSMGPVGTPEATYIGVMQHNTKAMIQALKPEQGE